MLCMPSFPESSAGVFPCPPKNAVRRRKLRLLNNDAQVSIRRLNIVKSQAVSVFLDYHLHTFVQVLPGVGDRSCLDPCD